MGTFLGGVKEEIRARVRMFKLCTLRDAIELARLREETINKQRRNKPLENLRHSNVFEPEETLHNSTMPINSGVTLSSPTKRLSWEEMQKRREKGLCFNCNEKFALGHRCQVPQVFFIEA